MSIQRHRSVLPPSSKSNGGRTNLANDRVTRELAEFDATAERAITGERAARHHVHHEDAIAAAEQADGEKALPAHPATLRDVTSC
ncbi:MAG TPA: hypothetical protein VGC41_08635 [Kofleriaceae bacterium]